MNHYTDDYVHPTFIKILKRAEKMGINLCQWYDRKGRFHLFSPVDEKRIYGETQNDGKTSTRS